MLERLISVNKAHRRLTLVQDGQAVAAFPVLVGAVAGPKQRTGDSRTPEGEYRVAEMLPDDASMNNKGYHKGLHISYPAPHDIRRGRALGFIDQETHDALLAEYAASGVTRQDTELGGMLAIHGGLSPDETFERGTQGCLVLRNADMDAVYAFSRVGLTVVIEP